ncbi:hypothetical protein F7725_012274 [Dissostichus mawsoni]|uniref:ATP-binding cassette, sub-family B (MDR/TAP), member 9 n=1 Tax=Dissostichus mawsoni TaxID=36200 RepID=A0A7J5YLV9_DISMA|nr:hypothetical protein F7725_012274 [Dissostichus mawsoni]
MSSVLDLWGCVLLRAPLLLGACIGVSWNKQDGPPRSMEYFAKPVITLSALALVSSLAMGVRGGVFTLMFGKLNLRLRNHLFRTLMRQEIAFFDENHTGDIISRLSADTTQVSDLISNNINVFLRSIVKGIGFFIFMFGMSWKLTLVTIMGFPFIAVVSKLYGDYYKKLTKEVQTTLAEANKVAEETISSMRTVRSFANEEGEADTYLSKLLVMFQLNKKQALAYAGYMWSSCISELALEIAVLYYGGHLVVSGQMSSGSLISFLYTCWNWANVSSIASVYTGLMQGVGAAEKVFEYLDREPKHRADGTEAPDTCSGLVEFKDITFAYPTRPDTDILKGVSFTLRPGEVTAVVGPSGSGKSSCVSLLENFYRPQRGEEPVLFARTVEENITYGLSDVSMEAVEQAATKANAHEFISCLPTGYQTKGTQLSGGQKQRVAIARALVRNPRVLILDEATSALDADSEHIVQTALNSIMQDHTVLVIAHRLSTVEKADNIIVIESGRVAEQGSGLASRRGPRSSTQRRNSAGNLTEDRGGGGGGGAAAAAAAARRRETCASENKPNISVSSSMYGVSGAQQQGFQVFRGSTFSIICSIQPQYPGGSFLLSSSTHNTQPAVNHSAHFLFPAAEPPTRETTADLSSESRLLSVTVTGVRSDPEPFIIRAVVLPLTQLLVTIGLYFYCKATRGRRPSRQEDIELDYDDLGVPAEEEGAQGADFSQLKEAVEQMVAEKQSQWDDFLDPVLFLFRTSSNPTTKC